MHIQLEYLGHTSNETAVEMVPWKQKTFLHFLCLLVNLLSASVKHIELIHPGHIRLYKYIKKLFKWWIALLRITAIPN